MRILAGVFAALLLATPLPRAFAEETGPTIGPAAPDQVEKPKAEKLNDLFAALKGAASDDAARRAEDAILHLWLESGSDTVDVLMTWALQAMAAKDYSVALDYLDRVVTMKPDYAEGWNKRATVYFLTDDYAKSLSDIARTLALEPRHFGALSGLGIIMQNVGNDKRAIEAYKDALAVDPYLENVKRALDDLEATDAGKQI